MNEYYIKLTPLTPIHIGSGDKLKPFEYVIADKKLYRFTLEDFMLALSEQAQSRFVQAVECGDREIRKFVFSHVLTAAKVSKYRIRVTPAAEEDYYSRFEHGGLPEIASLIRTSNQPYLPGSSLKGALRTAMLYHTMDEDTRASDGAKLEKEIFRYDNIQEDPFRALKLSDGKPLKENSTMVHLVKVNVRHGNRWSDKIPILTETLPGSLCDNVEYTSRHPFTLDTDFFDYHPHAYNITLREVVLACRDFYGKHLREELAFTRNSPAAAAYQALEAQAEEINASKNGCLVRLGWGSGHEGTTVAYRLRGSSRSISRRLTSEGFPLGWAELRFYKPQKKQAP